MFPFDNKEVFFMMNKILKKGLCAILTCIVVSGVWLVNMHENNFVKPVKAESNDSSIYTLKSYVTDMNIKGYIGTNIKNNIKYWQIGAYEDNQGIIRQIDNAQSGVISLGNILGTDYYGVSNYYDISIHERNNQNSLGWTLKSMPNKFDDRDLRFSNDQNAKTNWSGAKELWLKIDASTIPTKTSVRVAFEENAVGRESYSLINGSVINLYYEDSTKVTSTASGGFVELPAEFKGYIVLPLNSSYYSCYWKEGGNNKLDINNVVQFQLAVKGDQEMVGKTLYMDEFAIVGNVNGEHVPVGSYLSSDTYKAVWNFEGLHNGDGYINSSLPWYGEFVGKLLTGMAYSYRISPDQELLNSAVEIITDLKTAQGEDGYLGTYMGGSRYSIETSNWDLWNQYHIIVGLLEWYKLTGEEDYLIIAKDCIDCIYETFKDRSYVVTGGFETNRGISHGYAMMYQITGEKKYLDEAERIIIEDCKGDPSGWYNTALRGRHFYQSNNNRWEILHMMMTLGILYEETGNEEYYDVMSILWYDILETDIHNTGGFTTNEGAQGNPYMDGVIETCCTIAWLAFTNEFYKYSQSVEVADEFERSYYNGLMGSLLDNDKYCTYNSPMNGVQGTCGHYDGRKVYSQQDISFQYHSDSPDMNCCQANFARGLGQLSQWALMSEENDLYLNYYGTSSITTKVGGVDVTIKQTTQYPANGNVKIEVTGLEKTTKFKLNLRVPTWAYGSTAIVDGKRYVLEEGEYFEINKTWSNGDIIQLDLQTSFHYWAGEKNQSGLTSIYYGPVLLTLDQAYAKGFDQSTQFDAIEIEKVEVQSGTALGCMLTCDVETDSGTVKLIDYASAGKYNGTSTPSTYWTWLNVNNQPEPNHDSISRWKDSKKHKVNFSEEVVLEKTQYYSGEIVKFTIENQSNIEISEISIGEGIQCSVENGVYSFVMPENDVTILVKYVANVNQDEEPGGTDKKDDNNYDNKNNKKIIMTISIISSAVLAAGTGVFIFKKRKNKMV